MIGISILRSRSSRGIRGTRRDPDDRPILADSGAFSRH